jgi:quercetin dioxygenase-like cupin family protein
MNAVTESIEDKIQQIKRLAHDLPQVTMPTKHFLVDGMYARQIMIPSGTAFVGRRHKKFHYFLVLRGGAWTTGEDGELHNLQPGMLLLCSPGCQRVGVTYADTIFVTVHRTDEDLLKNIEDDCVEYDSTSRYGVGNEILQCLPPKESK